MARFSKQQLILIGAIVIIVGGIFVLMQYQPITQMQTEVRQPSIAVSAQTITNDEVVINSLYLDKPGYVVIHKDADGKPGAVIGNSELISGERTNFRVQIDPAQAGTKVFAMLHYDDDDDGVYGFPDEDKPVLLEDAVVVKPIDITQPVQEETQTMEETAQTESYIIEADDSGFYQDSTKITSLSVNSDSTVSMTFKVRTTNVYYGGLDFRSSKFSTQKASPGGNATVEFVADESFKITSYWPSSSQRKADLQITVV